MKILCLAVLLIPWSAQASVDFGKYTLQEGIDWNPISFKSDQNLKAAFESPSQDSTFTIREFSGLKNKSLKKNVKSWLNDYRSYGFTISNSKPVKYGDDTYGYLIEAIHRNSGKIFKQYMSIKKDRLVTLTCHSNRVNGEFKDCGKTLSSFRWSE